MADILLAEDDDSVRAFVKRALEMDGHRVTEAADGQAAQECLRAAAGFELLLSDICMPETDGISLAKWVAGRFPHMTIVLMTGYAEQRDGAEELGRIVTDIIAKPFSLAHIRHRVNRALPERARAS